MKLYYPTKVAIHATGGKTRSRHFLALTFDGKLLDLFGPTHNGRVDIQGDVRTGIYVLNNPYGRYQLERRQVKKPAYWVRADVDWFGAVHAYRPTREVHIEALSNGFFVRLGHEDLLPESVAKYGDKPGKLTPYRAVLEKDEDKSVEAAVPTHHTVVLTATASIPSLDTVHAAVRVIREARLAYGSGIFSGVEL